MDTAFFILLKLIGLALQVDNWLVMDIISLVAGRFARWHDSVTLAALMAVGIFPIGDILLRFFRPSFHRAPLQNKSTEASSSMAPQGDGRPRRRIPFDPMRYQANVRLAVRLDPDNCD